MPFDPTPESPHDPALTAYLRALPKAELHLHLEGTLEPELAFALAARNQLSLRYTDAAALRAAYQFADLQSFLDIYYETVSVLRSEADFHDLTWAYLKRVAQDGVRHAEVFFDPQSHTARGIPLGVVIDGITAALHRGHTELGISSGLILCFLRHLSEDEAFATLTRAEPFLDRFIAVGLDSSELGHPPAKFARVFARARALGLRAVAHAGEEGPAEYIRQAIEMLHVERIDHGVRCLEDLALVAHLVETQLPLTVCPLSNVKLRVVDRLEAHPLKTLLDRGVRVTINSDDPAYFGGYIGENYRQTARALGLAPTDLARLCRHSVAASFLPAADKTRLIAELDAVPRP